jgi:hypothetical protein
MQIEGLVGSWSGRLSIAKMLPCRLGCGGYCSEEFLCDWEHEYYLVIVESTLNTQGHHQYIGHSHLSFCR